MLSKIFRFGQKKQSKKVHVSDSDDDSWIENFQSIERGLPCLEGSQIRLLVYKDHDKRGDKVVLFDSKTDIQDNVSEQVTGNSRPVRKRVSSDVQLLGEMIFGSVEMTYKGPTVKAHSMRTPPRLLLTKVFALKPPRTAHGGSSPSNHSNASNLSSELSSSVRFSESVSSVSSMTSPVTSSDNEESSVIAKSVPTSTSCVSLPRSFQLQNIAEGFSNSTSVNVCHSLTFPRKSSSSYQRRWLRSQKTRMDYGCMKRNESFNEEMSMRLRRRPKIGIGILFSLWEGKSISEENNRLFQNFVFSHFPLFESHIHRLKRMVEKALLSSVQMSGRYFQDALLNAANTFATNILNLYYAPRIRNPLWLTMLSHPDQCNTICDDLVPEIVMAAERYNTKQTNYFLSSLLTAVLTYHVAWVTTVTPSSEVARRAYLDKHSSDTINVLGKSNPYNPLWAQLSELYGACGEPAKMARTVIIGQDQHLVTIILHILSYFIRCSEVFDQPLEQSPKNIASYLDSLEADLEEGDLTESTLTWETISEKSEEILEESTRCTKNLSQNSKSYLRDAKMATDDLMEIANEELDNYEILDHSEVPDCSEKNVENSRNAQTNCLPENFDSCGEDSGICSTDFESSVEVSINNSKNCCNCLQEYPQGKANCTENYEKFARNVQTCLRNSTVSKTESEDCTHVSHDGSNDSKNCLKDSGKCPRNSEKSCEKCVESCQSCEIQNESKANTVHGCPEDELFERCKNLSIDVSRRSSRDVIFDGNAELCDCNGVFSGNSKEHKLWKSFLRSSCCNKNSRSLDRQCLSTNPSNNTKLTRTCSSEKRSDCTNGTKLCVQNDGKILSLDRQSILDMFLNSYPLCPVCKGHLNFFDQDLNVMNLEKSVCLCQDCDKVKWCCCQMVEKNFGENERCPSSVTIVSDDYSSGISVQSEAEITSLSSLSIDSGLNEHCLQSNENLVDKCTSEDKAYTLEIPESGLDENFTEDDMSNKNSQDCQLFSFGRSLMAGYCEQYVPDFVLHGTDHCTEEQAKQSMQTSLEQPVVDSPISESVIITGDTDKWECTVKTLSKQRKIVGNHHGGFRSKKGERSTLVHNLLTSFCDLWELNMPATFCLMHLEDKMKELYLRSKVVSEYLLTQKYVTMRDLTSTFGYGECDLALIMSIVGVHSPEAISRIPLP